MRLFIAHSVSTKCPLMDLTTLSIKEYHAYINEIAKGNINFVNSQLSDDRVILRSLIGVDNTELHIGLGVLKS